MGRIWTGRPRRFAAYLGCVLICYFAVSFIGLTTSNVSAVWGTEDERSTVLLGQFRQTRSDEYLRGSPRMFADLRGIPNENYTPLDITGSRDFQERRAGLSETFNRYTRPLHQVLIDEIARRVPLRMGFSLLWWLSTVSLFVFLPIWFRLVGLSGRVGALAALAVFGSSLNAWFSYLPSALVGSAALAAVCGLVAIDRFARADNRLINGALGLILAFYCGRSLFAVAEYPPWGLPILFCFGASTLLSLCSRHQLRAIVGAVSATAAVMIVAIGLNYLHNKTVYSVVLDTVYPGNRRTKSGDSSSFVWSGALSWFMQGDFARTRSLTNPEMALGPTFLLIPVAFLVFGNRFSRSNVNRDHLLSRRFGLIFFVASAGLILWATVNWPKTPGLINPLVLIPAIRATQIASILALLAVFVLSEYQTTNDGKSLRFLALGAAILTVVVAGPDIERFRVQYLVGAGSHLVWIAVLTVIVLSTVVVCFVGRTRTAVLLAVCSLGSSVLVNPLTLGVGPFEDSKAVKKTINIAKQQPELRWATTGFFQDALMTSTGVPQLSGQQPLGPNSDAWRKLDPTEASRDAWNRGQAYVNFQWDGRPGITIWNPSPDVIQVVINPCRPELDDLDLGWVVTADEIYFDCLRKETTVTWMGAPLNIYRRSAVAMFEE